MTNVNIYGSRINDPELREASRKAAAEYDELFDYLNNNSTIKEKDI